MGTRVLILTEPHDEHALLVAEAIRRKGGEPILWQTSDFPTLSCESIRYEGEERRVRVRGPDLDLADPAPDVVWNRRPAFECDLARLHPADREYAVLQCREFRTSQLLCLAPDAFWVNRRAAGALADCKLRQHEVARATGVAMPATLYGNDPKEVRSFIRDHGGEVVYKSLRSSAGLWTDGEKMHALYTVRLTEADLTDDDLVAAVPAIYQELVPKAYELRVTVMGRHIFAARLLSQQTSRGRIDFRLAYEELRAEPAELPGELTIAIHAFMERMGLVFGCLDIIVTPDGRHLFLEVNEMGQFLFIEERCELPLLDAFAEFLVQARPDFRWSAGPRCLRMSELVDQAERAKEQNLRRHAPRRPQAYREDAEQA